MNNMTTTITNYNSTEEIRYLPLSTHEVQHKSRSRKGYHVYLSNYFLQFSSLSYEQKNEVMMEHGVWLRPLDDDSIDSVMTPQTPMSYEVMKAASRNWSLILEDELKIGWKLRAEDLNSRPPNDGKFVLIPYSVGSNLQDNILCALNTDWLYVVSMIRSTVLRKKERSMKYLNRKYKFGSEVVKLNSQAY